MSDRVIVCMGVSGTGKTSVARRVAELLDAAFLEGDDLHPEANVRIMASGSPLTDDDRWPWLRAVADAAAACRKQGRAVVVTCSALRRAYRDLLTGRIGGDVLFVHLDADPDVLRSRLEGRTQHFMPASQLADQLATLEPPGPDEHAVTIDVDRPLDAVVDAVVDAVQAAVAAEGA